MSGELQGEWQSLDLTQNANDSTLWQGTLNTTTPPQDIRFIVQAVNGVGLTALSANQGAYYTPDGFVAVTPQQQTTNLALNAASSGAYGNQLNVSATLTSNGNPVANEVVWFGLGSQRASAFTNANGVAQATLSLYGSPTTYELRASFDGKPLLAASSTQSDFTIVKQNTQLNIEAPSSAIQYSDPANFFATVRDVDNRALGQVSLAFIFNGDHDGASRLEITNLVSRAEFGTIPVRGGNYNVAVSFGQTVMLNDGTTLNLTDTRYNGSSANTNLVVAPEDATLEYTGDSEIEVGNDVQLAAQVTQADDGSPGDITRAQVQFIIKTHEGQELANETADVNSEGIASATAGGIFGGAYTIETKLVGGYFAAPDVNTTLNVTGERAALSHNTRIRTKENKALDALDLTFRANEDKTDFFLRGTKPGSFKYVETLNNTGDVSLGLNVTITIPSSDTPPLAQTFCLVGANPIRIYSNAQLTREVTENIEIAPSMPLAVADENSQTCMSEIQVHVIVPARAKRFLSLDLAFAGKGAGGFAKNSNKAFFAYYMFLTNVKGSQVLGNPQLPANLESNVGAILVGNRLMGVGGFVLDAHGKPRVGYSVRVLDKKQEVGAAQTDANGFFLIRLKAGGPYKVQLREPDTNTLLATADITTLAKKEFVRPNWKPRE